MIDFRTLSHFVAACEHENLASAAQELGIAPSTLSASLKALESGFGVSLFRRHENGLAPRRLAHALYRAAVSMLLIEDLARRRVRAPAEPVRRLTIDIQLRFAFGQLRRALANAVAETARVDPLLLVDPSWPLEASSSLFATGLDELGFSADYHMSIEAIAREPEAGEVILRRDPWMLVRRQIRGAEDNGLSAGADQPWIVPLLPPGLIEQISRYAAEQGRTLQMLDVPLDEWPQLLDDHPRAAFPLPMSAIGRRLGVSRVAAAPLDPPLRATLIARTDGSVEATAFLEHLQAALASDTPSKAFAPVLTERRLRYFNLAYEVGRLSVAAKTIGVAQPAMSQQLQKLEESLGTTLFNRSTFGLVRTQASEQFALAAGLLDKRLRELEMRGASAALEEGGRLSLGVLPSIGHRGWQIDAVTQAILALRSRYPDMNLQVLEAPIGRLHSMIAKGQLGIAVVDAAPATLPRLSLDAGEPLAVIVDPRHTLLPQGPVAFADLAGLPLLLASSHHGLRQILDGKARDLGLKLRPRHEVDALDMIVDLVLHGQLATILPPSVVEDHLAAGRLAAHPIISPEVGRRFYVVHSGLRSLTPAEREFVRVLRTALQGDGNAASRDDPIDRAAL
jgi:LysR family nitrogen assimilation transcriptional regulator